MLVVLKVNPAFKKKIYNKVINPNLLHFTMRIVGSKLIIHSSDFEFVEKVMDKNCLSFKFLSTIS